MKVEVRRGRNIICFIFLALAFFLPRYSPAQVTQTVEAEGRAFFEDYTTPADAKAIALNNARRNALESALKVSARSAVAVYDDALIDAMTELATMAFVSVENVLESRWEPLEGGRMAWHTKIKATVRLMGSEEAGTLEITEASIGRPGQKESDTLFNPGERIQVRVKVNERAYLQMFVVDRNGLAEMLYPSRVTGQERVRPNRKFVFPTEHEMRFGIRIITDDLRDKEEEIESVLVVATRKKMNFFSDDDVEHLTVSDIMKELSLLNRSEWAARTTSYTVKE